MMFHLGYKNNNMINIYVITHVKKIEVNRILKQTHIVTVTL